MSLILTAKQKEQIESEGCKAYPNECCGAMLGKDVGEQRIVTRLAPLSNSFSSDEQYHRFSLNPKELMQVEKTASSEGLAVLGFYHSHPDHPAKPSEYDRQHAWPYYSYVIVAIAKGKPGDMTSWQLVEVTEQYEVEKIAIE